MAIPELPMGAGLGYLLGAADLSLGRRPFVPWPRAWTSLLTHSLPPPLTAPPLLKCPLGSLGKRVGWGVVAQGENENSFLPDV